MVGCSITSGNVTDGVLRHSLKSMSDFDDVIDGLLLSAFGGGLLPPMFFGSEFGFCIFDEDNDEPGGEELGRVFLFSTLGRNEVFVLSADESCVGVTSAAGPLLVVGDVEAWMLCSLNKVAIRSAPTAPLWESKIVGSFSLLDFLVTVVFSRFFAGA